MTSLVRNIAELRLVAVAHGRASASPTCRRDSSSGRETARRSRRCRDRAATGGSARGPACAADRRPLRSADGCSSSRCGPAGRRARCRAGVGPAAPPPRPARGNAVVGTIELAGVHDVRIRRIDRVLAVLAAGRALERDGLQILAPVADVDDAAIAAVILERSVHAERRVHVERHVEAVSVGRFAAAPRRTAVRRDAEAAVVADQHELRCPSDRSTSRGCRRRTRRRDRRRDAGAACEAPAVALPATAATAGRRAGGGAEPAEARERLAAIVRHADAERERVDGVFVASDRRGCCRTPTRTCSTCLS